MEGLLSTGPTLSSYEINKQQIVQSSKKDRWFNDFKGSSLGQQMKYGYFSLNNE